MKKLKAMLLVISSVIVLSVPAIAQATTSVTDFAADVGTNASTINAGIFAAAVAALVIFVALYGIRLMIRAFKGVK